MERLTDLLPPAIGMATLCVALTLFSQTMTKNAERASVREAEILLEKVMEAQELVKAETEIRIKKALQEYALEQSEKATAMVVQLRYQILDLEAMRKPWQEKGEALRKEQVELYEKLCPPIPNRPTARAWISTEAVKEYQDFSLKFAEPIQHINEITACMSTIGNRLFVAEEIAAYTARTVTA